MEYSELWWLVFTALMGGIVATYGFVKRANQWFYVASLGEKQYCLPPGDMGWPFIGNMLSFLKAFKYGDPDSFISNFHTRFGQTRIYRTFMFGNPSIIITAPNGCRQVLMDEEKFGPGWPISVRKLLGKKGLHGISNKEHKRLRQLTSASIKGGEAMSIYLEYIKDVITTSLEEWACEEKPTEFLTKTRKVGFKIIMRIILGTKTDPVLETMEEEYSLLSNGLKSMNINFPGFAFHKALKARKALVKEFAVLVEERRNILNSNESKSERCMVDLLMEVEDEDGRKLSDEEIVDLIIIYLLAGHESFAHASMWTVLYLQEHPNYYQKAKKEQEEILKRRPSTESGLSLAEIKEMEYISKVIDETLRLSNLSFALFREAKTDVNINGFTIPKGWKVLPWIRGIHMDPEIYANPNEFNPSRWEDRTQLGTYMPFGAGSRLCPGMNLAKLEMTIFLHYFLLHYKLERLTPGCKVRYLPMTKPSDNCVARIRKL